jgi:hypothetical protein
MMEDFCDEFFPKEPGPFLADLTRQIGLCFRILGVSKYFWSPAVFDALSPLDSDAGGQGLRIGI